MAWRCWLNRPRLRIKQARFMPVLAAALFVGGVLLFGVNLVTFVLDVRREQRGIEIENADDPFAREIASEAYAGNHIGFPEFSRTVDCKPALLSRDVRPVRNSDYKTAKIKPVPLDWFIGNSSRCDLFLNDFGYNRYPPSEEEEQAFPLAFILLFHRDFYQVHFLLRAIYRPHNVYCLFPDAKQSPEFVKAAYALASCLPNVFVASKLLNITYAGFSRLLADLHCMHDLLRHEVQWKYVINLPGQEFPLRTNLEMVQLLKMYRGANDVVGMTGTRMLAKHYKYKYKPVMNAQDQLVMKNTGEVHPPPPLNLSVVKGSAYNTLSRAFVRFVFIDPRVRFLLDWIKDVYSPDEYFWAILNHSPIFAAPGYYPGIPDHKRSFTAFTIWQHDFPCQTFFVREICILTPADLPVVLRQTALFANKFFLFHYPAVLHCLDQRLYNASVLRKTRPLPKPYEVYFALPATRSPGGADGVDSDNTVIKLDP